MLKIITLSKLPKFRFEYAAVCQQAYFTMVIDLSLVQFASNSLIMHKSAMRMRNEAFSFQDFCCCYNY